MDHRIEEADMHSRLSITVEKIVNEVREASRQSGGSSDQPLSIVEIIRKLNPSARSSVEPRVQRIHSPILHYGLSVVSVAIALGVAFALQRYQFREVELPVFTLAIVFTTWYAGVGPSALAVVLSTACFAYFFAEPLYSFEVSAIDLPYFLIFVVWAAIVASFNAVRRRIEDNRRPSGAFRLRRGGHMDITERKHAEQASERLRQTEADLVYMNRVSMMGEMAASLAHEIKQPMAAAALNGEACANWLRRDVPNVTEASRAASAMVADVMRAGGIIDRVSSLYKRGKPERELVDLNEIVRGMSELLRHMAKRNAVSIRTDLDPELPAATADRVQLQQVLMNLMLNGIEAMQDTHGELSIASKRTEDGQLLISVSDTGVGLSTDEAASIFKTFFTTKPQGTGMGLSISRRIIASHGGHLWASPNTERGATFQFTLPVGARASSPAGG